MRGGIIPGLHSAAHAAAFFAARDRLFTSGGPRRCTAFAKHGGKCGSWALRNHEQCALHAPVAVRREIRLRRLARPKTAAGAALARRREQSRMQRIIWKRDRHAPGETVTLGGREYDFQANVQRLGFVVQSMSPATIDAARWCWLHVQSKRKTIDQFRDRIHWHMAQD